MKTNLTFTMLISLFLLPHLALSNSQIDTFSKFPNKYFVETGSHEGNGIKQALQAGFEHVYSIEVFPCFYEMCTKTFTENPNVKLFLGSSGEILYDVIKDIDSPITFWLDGHCNFGGDLKALGYEQCPLIKELDLIKKHHIKTHTILIDDVRLLGTATFEYISLNQIMKKLLEINPNYKFSYENGVVPNDILVAQVY
jgi:hypothetical protein